MSKAIYPGSFDPITNGHLDILERSIGLFSEITIVVAETGLKDPLFSPQERVRLIKEVLKERKDFKDIKVELWAGLIMEYAQRHNVQAMIRGLRAASDFEYEFMMAGMNKKLNPLVETIFMMTSQELFFVSSSMVKELYRYGGDISPYVPHVVVDHLSKKINVTEGLKPKKHRSSVHKKRKRR